MVVSHQRCPCRDGAIHGSFSRGIGRSDRRNGRERRIDGLTHRDIDSDIKRRCQIDRRSLAPPRAVPRYSIKTSTRWNKNNKSMHQTVKLVFANKCWTSACRATVSRATDATGISIAGDAWVAVTVSEKSIHNRSIPLQVSLKVAGGDRDLISSLSSTVTGLQSAQLLTVRMDRHQTVLSAEPLSVVVRVIMTDSPLRPSKSFRNVCSLLVNSKASANKVLLLLYQPWDAQADVEVT